MSVMLTDSQRAVVEDQGGSLLVSAAAGSGKTRVLVDRLFRRVLGEEQANMDDFLIITYTRAAAAELRERIAQELAGRMSDRPGDRHLQRQLLLVYQADIKTIDAFCTALLRENVHLLDFQGERGLTADFRVLDEGEAALLRRRVLGRVLEAFYASMGPGAAQLADAFGFGRDDRGLEELVLDLHGKVQSHAYPLRWLEEQAALWRSLPADGGRTVYGAELLAGLGRKARHWAALLEDGVSQMADDGPLWRAYSPGFTGAARQLAILAERTEEGWLWTVTGADTAAAGRGRCELRYLAEDTVVKSRTYGIYVSAALGSPPDGQPGPWQRYLDRVLEIGAAAQAAAERAQAAVDGLDELSNLELLEIWNGGMTHVEKVSR